MPLYFQVAQHLENAINSGALPTGTLLQNEVDLAAVPRTLTPDDAPSDAASRGQGPGRPDAGASGPALCSPKLRRPLELTSLYDDLDRAGRKPTTEVLSFEMVDAEEDVAAELELAEGSPSSRSSGSDRPVASRSPR